VRRRPSDNTNKPNRISKMEWLVGNWTGLDNNKPSRKVEKNKL